MGDYTLAEGMGILLAITLLVIGAAVALARLDASIGHNPEEAPKDDSRTGSM